MPILILAEHQQGQLNPTVYALLVAAQQLDAQAEIHVLLAGTQAAQAAKSLQSSSSVHKILLAEHHGYEHDLAENIAALLAELAGSLDEGATYQAVLAAADSTGKDILPRAAALLDVNMISDVLAIESAHRFKRPIYAGSLIAKVESTDPIQLLTIRTTAFDTAPQIQTQNQTNTASHQVIVESLSLCHDLQLSRFIHQQSQDSTRPELTTAKTVVAGGRGLGSAENFALVEQLADKLHAAVGASRAAVDAGYVPNELQIGQTGKVIAPDLYIGVGISGAVQHLAGMQASKVIVAINKDEEAPIFQVADYGLVADLFATVPELTAKL